MRNGHTEIVLILNGEWSNADRFVNETFWCFN